MWAGPQEKSAPLFHDLLTGTAFRDVEEDQPPTTSRDGDRTEKVHSADGGQHSILICVYRKQR